MILDLTALRSTLREKLRGVAVFLGILWGVYLLEFLVALIFRSHLAQWGLVPRTFWGLAGIVTMPFLHGGFWHLLGNSFPLAALLTLLAVSRDRPWTIVAALCLCGGTLLWLVGRPAVHIGASGLIMGLIAFLIVVGFIERKLVSLIVAVLVFFFYGSAVFWAVFSFPSAETSWEGHLCGAVGGGLVAFVWTRPRTAQWLAQHEFRMPRIGNARRRRPAAKSKSTLAR